MTYTTLEKSDIQQLVAGFSIETTPKGALKIGDFRSWLPAGTEVYVTFLSGTEFSDTLRTCAELNAQGMRPVPHLALRNFQDEIAIRQALDEISRQKIKRILLIAGAASNAKGRYDSVATFLKTGLLEEYAIESVDFAGHPEGAPHIPPAAAEEAEAFKQGYALTYPREYGFITQFCFAAQPVIDWHNRLLARDIDLPIKVGVPGVASMQSLLKHAQNCGIGASMDFLRKNSHNLRQLMRPRKPDALLCGLARFQRDNPEHRFQQLHFFPLGGFEKTVRFIQAVQAGQFTFTADGFQTED